MEDQKEYQSYEVGEHTVTICAGYAANYTAWIDHGSLMVGSDDSADDWAEAWVEVDGHQAYTICNDGRAPGNSEVRNREADNLLEKMYDDGDLDEDEIRDALHDALNDALDDYESAVSEAGEEAVKDMIENEGYRCFYTPGSFANDGSFTLVTLDNFDPDEYWGEDWQDDDTEEMEAEEWARVYYRYPDAITESYESLTII